ncbi:hypothetical protein BHE74_00047453 [Ensete ventricosum]|nr:hypothetical protein GW17_00008469 [Ensete ventricosum]RWW46612.1 hypothetical protein BHE74_00047453 [Ensete ventricosum]RZS01084.1 hypothetical protein BHM03_00030882 [Ensete ventricosum]
MNVDPIFGSNSKSPFLRNITGLMEYDGLLWPAFPRHITVRVAHNGLTRPVFSGYIMVRVAHDRLPRPVHHLVSLCASYRRSLYLSLALATEESNAFTIVMELHSGVPDPVLLRCLVPPPQTQVSLAHPIAPMSVSRSRHHFLRHCSSDVTALKVGEEIKGETMPLNSGQRTYELLGLRRSASYEVKISYPASVYMMLCTQAFVIVTAIAAGVVAKPNVPERELVIYNIGI